MRRRPTWSHLGSPSALAGLPGIVLCLGACSADPPARNETDAVVSVRGEVDYGSLERYLLVSALDELCLQSDTEASNPLGSGAGGALGDDSCVDLDHDADAAILERIEANLEDLGYERLPMDAREEADFIVSVGIVAKSLWDLSERFCLDNELVDGCVRPLTQQALLVPRGSLIVHWLAPVAGEGGDYTSFFVASIDKRVASGVAIGLSSVGQGGQGGESDVLVSWLLGVDQAHEQAPYLETGR